MTPDEMAAKTEPAERQSAGAAVDNLLEEQLRATLKDLQRASLQPKPVEDLHGSEDVQSVLSRGTSTRTVPSEGRFTIVS